MIVAFIQNVTLLVSAVVVYTFIIRRWKIGSASYALFSGLLFGVVAVLGMMMPLILEPGVIFDGRSIIHSIAGLFGGPLTALVAALVSGIYRISIGGGGSIVGVFTIIQSSALGVVFYYLMKRGIIFLTAKTLIIFSLLVHLIMLYSFTFIPGMTYESVLNNLALPIILLYPPTTLIIAGLITLQENQLKAEKELMENENRLNKTQEIAHVGSWDLDLQENKLNWSDEAYRIFGADSNGLAHSYETFLDHVHPDDRMKVDQAYSDSVDAGMDSYEVEHRVVRPMSGEIRYVLERCEHFKDSSGKIIRSIGMVQDITDRKEYESKLHFMSFHDQLTDLYNRYYFEEELRRLSGSREYPITILSADLDGLKLINDTLGHSMGDQMLIDCAKVLRDSLRQCDILARIGGDEFAAILIATDAAAGEDVCRRIREKLQYVNKSIFGLPMNLSLGMATSIGPEEDPLYELLKKADDLMYRDKLYHRKSMRNQIVQALMKALAERDFIAEGHTDRLQSLTYEMGIKAGLTSSQLADLALLAQVHDLGKVGIPDQILFKEGPLNDEEWKIMHMHPEKGCRIASSSPDLAAVADLILKHHEFWNGAGYPQGLKEEDIPIECRILSIVDAFDAITNDRHYSKARTANAALEEIKRCAGSQFDPVLVEVFKAVLAK